LDNTLFSVENSERAVFLQRPNRFLLFARRSSGETAAVHVADPGRLKELLYPGNSLLITPAPAGSKRKTRWSLLGAEDSTGWILVNTSIHRKVSENLLLSPFSPMGKISRLKAEVKAPSGGSRFDFLLDDSIWVEVKGCTLRRNGIAMFPDAPTVRGRKHILELTEMASTGLRTAVVFLVFVRDVSCFVPNRETDPDFTSALETAVSAGVEVYPVQLSFTGRKIEYKGRIQFRFAP